MGTKRLRRRLRHGRDWLRAAAADAWAFTTRGVDPELPPLRLRFVGQGDFRALGDELLRVLVDCGLRRDARVLDIGCGVGRVALPLTHYLGDTATYDGFDVVRPFIRWCRRHITPAHPNFRFRHVDVRSSEYRERGIDAASFRFPYDDASFDVAFATSLFTHLVYEETRQYLRESARVLAPGGRLVATFFLLNDHSRAALPRLGASYRFAVDRGPIRLADADNPAVAVAIDEAALSALAAEAGFARTTIRLGTWSERPDGLTFQDVVICER